MIFIYKKTYINLQTYNLYIYIYISIKDIKFLKGKVEMQSHNGSKYHPKW